MVEVQSNINYAMAGNKWTPLILIIGGNYMALYCMKESKCFTRVSGGLCYAASGSCYNSCFENN